MRTHYLRLNDLKQVCRILERTMPSQREQDLIYRCLKEYRFQSNKQAMDDLIDRANKER